MKRKSFFSYLKIRREIRLFGFLIFCFVLSSCLSAEKDTYEDSLLMEDSFQEKEKKSSREIAYLKNISQLEEESNFQFVAKQMKQAIRNYSKLKQYLEDIESKLDKLITQQKVLAGDLKKINSYQAREESLSEESDFFDFDEEEEEESKRARARNDLSPREEESGDALQKEKNLKYSSGKKSTRKRAKGKWPSSFLKGKKMFKKEDYEKAIAQFQKYRNQNPEGDHYPEATFYIWQSFNKLKMPAEARVFFEELADSYPQSLWAGRAKKMIREKDAYRSGDRDQL